MRPYLLDINVLIALAWPNHVHHGEALDWFLRKAVSGFRTCPVTQIGFVRISSNPAFTADAVTPSQALALFQRIAALPGHGFWPDDLPLTGAFPLPLQPDDPPSTGAFPLPLFPTSHRQITDAYLIALSEAHDGVLATFDRGIAALARQCPERLEIVGS